MASDTSGHHERLAHDDRRDEIIDAVRAVVAESGISRLSISAVTKRVGCTRSLFYHYFPTKEDALQAALDQSIDAFMARLTAWNDQRVTGDIEGASTALPICSKPWSFSRTTPCRTPLQPAVTRAVRDLRTPRRRSHRAVYLPVDRGRLRRAPRGPHRPPLRDVYVAHHGTRHVCARQSGRPRRYRQGHHREHAAHRGLHRQIP